jgi:hypothetical protein
MCSSSSVAARARSTNGAAVEGIGQSFVGIAEKGT